MIDILEWTSFGLSMISVLLYGRSKLWGSIVGLLACVSFMWWGTLAGVPAALFFNVGFAFLYARNLQIAMGERHVWPDHGGKPSPQDVGVSGNAGRQADGDRNDTAE